MGLFYVPLLAVLLFFQGAWGFLVPGQQEIVSDVTTKAIKPIALGPLKITGGTIESSAAEKVVSAEAVLFGKAVRAVGRVRKEAGSEGKKPDEVDFAITFIDPLTIEKIPGVPFAVTDGRLIYKADAPPYFEARSEIKGIPLGFTVQFSHKEFEKTIVSVGRIPLGELIPETRDTLLAPLALDEVTIDIGKFEKDSGDKALGLTLTARADLSPLAVGPITFGTVELAGFLSKERKSLSFATPQPLVLEAIPGKRAEFKDFTITLSDREREKDEKKRRAALGKKDAPGSRVVITSRGTIVTIPVEFALYIGKEIERVTLSTGRTILGDLIPDFANGPAKDVALDQVELEFTAASYKERKKNLGDTITMRAVADLSSLPIGVSTISAVELEGILKKDAATLRVKLPQITFPEGGSLDSVELSLVGSKNRAIQSKASLSGKAVIPLPGGGTLPIEVSGELKGSGIELVGKPTTSLDLGELKLANPQVLLQLPKGKLDVQGTVEIIPGYRALLSVGFDKKTGTFVARSEVGGSPIRPLQDFPQLGQFAQIELLNPRVQAGTKFGGQFIALGGEARVFGGLFDADVRIANNKDGKAVRVELGMGTQRISDMVKELRGSVFDDIELHDARVIITTGEEYDDLRDVTYKQGFNIYGKAFLNGALKPVGDLTGLDERASVMLFAAVPVDPRQTIFKVNLPVGLVIKPDVATFNKLSLEIGGLPLPGISIIGGVTIKPSPKDDPLNLFGRLKVGVQDALFATTLKGMWKNPFGLRGLSIGDLAVQIGIDYALLVASGLPENVGLAGSLQLGKAKMSLAGKVAVKNADESMLVGSLAHLELADLVATLGQMLNAPVNTDNLPLIALDDLSLYVVPKTTNIGEIQYQEGIGGGCAFRLPGFTARGKFHMNSTSLSAEGYCSRMKFGPIIISGAGPDKVYNTPDDGPILLIDISLLKQRVYLSGLLEIEGFLKSQTEIDLSLKEMIFSFDTKVANVFDAYVLGRVGILKDPDIYLLIDFRSEFMSFIRRRVDEELTKFQKKVEADLSQAQTNVRQLNKQIDDFDRQINARKAEIVRLQKVIDGMTATAKKRVEAARADVEKKRYELTTINNQAQREIDEARRKVDVEQNKVNGLRTQINQRRNRIAQLQREIDQAQGIQKIDFAFRKGFEIVGLGTEIAGLEIAHGTATLALQAAQGILRDIAKKVTQGIIVDTGRFALKASEDFLKNVVKEAAFDPASIKEGLDITRLGFEIAGLETAKGSTIAARESAIGILEGLKQTAVVGIGEGGKLIVRSLTSIFEVNKARFEGSGKMLVNGLMPKLDLEITLFGQRRSATFQFDFKNPDASARAIGEGIVRLLAP
jgi:cell division septum initiation protein DivIVA